jgi:methylmalonyl-CoA mutase
MSKPENPAFPVTWQKLAEQEAPTLSVLMPDGLPRQALYTAPDGPLQEELPGLPPYTRGVRASMYVGRPWTIRQYAGFSTVEDTNAFFRQALAAGQTGLSVAFDLATHRGYDSDHERASADVGKAGVAVCSAADMARLFAGIDLGKVSVSMTMNGAVLPIMAAYIVAAEEQGVKPEQLSGTLQNDILKEFLVRNTYIYPPAESLRITTDIIAYCNKHLPKFNPISISGYHLHEAGATAVQELAFTLANGLTYVRAAKERGLTVEQFAPRLSFFFGIGMDFFGEIAKLRAARQLWATLLRDKFDVREPKALALRMHCQTSGVSLSEQDPLNNITRTAYEALAAVLGGTQSLHTNSYDEALALPSDTAARIARNTQLILAEETHVTKVVDPLGGSYFIEHQTAALVKAARELIERIETEGGMLPALENGWIQEAVQQSATTRQARLDTGADVIIGVNKYRLENEAQVETREVDNIAVRSQQISRLTELRRTRDEAKVKAALAALEEGARSTANLLELTLPAIRARATVGEVSAVLERVFTRYQAKVRTLKDVYAKARQNDAAFDEVKARVSATAPRLMILKLGQDGHDRGAKVIASAFGDLGFTVELGPLFDSPTEGAARTLAAKAQIVGLSTLAGAHKDLVPAFIKELHAAGGKDIIVVVGGVVPPQDYAALFAAGVAAVYGPGTDILHAAEELMNLLEKRNEPPRSRKESQ